MGARREGEGEWGVCGGVVTGLGVEAEQAGRVS